MTSGGYAHGSDVSVAMGYVRTELAEHEQGWSVELLAEMLSARMQKQPLFDSNASRMRSWSTPVDQRISLPTPQQNGLHHNCRRISWRQWFCANALFAGHKAFIKGGGQRDCPAWLNGQFEIIPGCFHSPQRGLITDHLAACGQLLDNREGQLAR